MDPIDAARKARKAFPSMSRNDLVHILTTKGIAPGDALAAFDLLDEESPQQTQAAAFSAKLAAARALAIEKGLIQ